ncbi:MAG: preprotein translocase subunit YajC [Candidatus Anammoximicrobium sp.]|nr:preprotein translocase subunit YajC [Candidatus Anammoximicrobium sp.]
MLSGLPTFHSLLLAAEGPASLTSLLLPIVMIGFLFYLLIVRPEKRKQSDVAKMQTNLKKNDHVVTIGGILGVVVNAPAGSNEVTLRVDENTRIRFLRSSISRVVSSEKSAEEEKES